MAVLSADLAGTGVTSNVLVPGGVTNTAMVGGANHRDKMLQPEIMAKPILWLYSLRVSIANSPGERERSIEDAESPRRCWD